LPEPAQELEGLLTSQAVDAGIVRRLALYGSLVLEANRRFNVTGARSAAEIAEQITDSLSVVAYVQPPYVDVGSGAGFPAIPVAIATGILPTMIESTAKKARLLRELLTRLGLGGSVLAERAEAAARLPEWRERFASGTCRAVATAAGTAELLLPLIAIGGAAVLQRGRLDAAEQTGLEDAALVLGAHVERVVAIEGERRIVLVRKDRATPLRFPRRSGLAQKRPLCS
jgi:16S rRNA (guanine527-N7)-methyltransferase